MLYMKYKKIWFRQRLRNPEVLRNNPNANCIHKNHKLAFGSDSVIFMNNASGTFLRTSRISAEADEPYLFYCR